MEVHDVADRSEIADALRLIANEDEPVLLMVEREDAWWAVVRVDGDEDPRVFLSDVLGAARSPYGGFLRPTDAEAGDDFVPGTCGGDFDVLVDLGTSPEDLRQMC